MYLAPLPPTKTDFCISLFEQVYLLSPRPSSLSAWNETMRGLSAENNQTRVCIHFSERAWLRMFHSSLVFLPRVVKWVTAVLVSLQVGTCGNVEGGGGWVGEWWGLMSTRLLVETFWDVCERERHLQPDWGRTGRLAGVNSKRGFAGKSSVWLSLDK